MTVKLTDLKNDIERVKIPFIREGIKDFITVFNPTEEQRSKLMSYLNVRFKNLEGEAKELKIKAEDVVKIFYKELTDLDIKDEDIKNIIKNPSKELVEVNSHINDIIHELVMELISIKKRDFQRLKEFEAQNSTLKELKAFLDSIGLTKDKLKEVNVDLDMNNSAKKEGEH